MDRTWCGVSGVEMGGGFAGIEPRIVGPGVQGQTCFEWYEPDAMRAERGGGGPPAAVCGLSDRETEVTRLLGSGRSAKEAAAILGISMKTVDNHRQNAMRKLGLKCRAEMVLFAVKNGLVRV